MLLVAACGGSASTSTTAPATTGTITISAEGWEGLAGYRLLAVVERLTGSTGFDLKGGAFWTLIDSDPFSAEDVVHPTIPFDPDREGQPFVDEYSWDETARLEPGTYRIHLWANPGELYPYGKYYPRAPVERECQIDVEVRAGENTTVVISDIPIAGDECP